MKLEMKLKRPEELERKCQLAELWSVLNPGS
jgi:hypothetical protein